MKKNIDIFKRWFANVLGNKPFAGACTAVSDAEVKELFECAQKAWAWLRAKGTTGRITGKGVPASGFTFRAGLASFTVHPPTRQVKTGVALTSRMAYAELDKDRQAEKVARAVIALHAKYRYVSDSQVAEAVNIPAGRVSARRAEIKDAGRVLIGGCEYVFEQAPENIKCPITGKTVQGWRLAQIEGQQIAMF